MIDNTKFILTYDFATQFLVNIASLFLLLRFIYYRNAAHRESLTGFIMFGNGVFLVTALLHNVDMSIGFAFGLFAVFSMLRYRTETLTVRDMTYLFILIAIALITALSKLALIELLLVNGFLCGLAAFCETTLLAKNITVKDVVYEKIDLIKTDKYRELISDLEQRLGYKIERVDIGEVDFMRDTAVIKVFYNEQSTKSIQQFSVSVLENERSPANIKEQM